ncbi:MAG: hypothetical protein AB7K09_23420 [Planctomycetota bacterium]
MATAIAIAAPKSVLCPSCTEPLFVTDLACPRCDKPVRGETLDILRTYDGRDRAGGDARPRRRRPRVRYAMGSREQWLKVRDGFNLMYRGMFGACVIVSHALLLWLFVGNAVLPVAMICILVTDLMIIRGQYLLLSTPAESGFRGKIVASLSLSLLVALDSLTNSFGVSFGEWSRAVGVCIGIARISADVLFLLFIRDVGRYFGHYDMAHMASHLVRWTVALSSLFIASYAWQVAFGEVGQVGAFMFMLWVIASVFVVPYFVLRNLYLIRDAGDTLTARVELVRFADAVMTER